MPNRTKDRNRGPISPIDRARAYDDQPEPGWRPQPGDVVAGTVIDVDVRTATYRDQAREVPVVVLEQPDGSRIAVWALHTVLLQELARLRPRIGEELAIRRLDDAEQGYKRYRVFAARQDDTAGIDWAAIETAGSDGPVDDHDDQGDVPVSELFSRGELEGDDAELPF